MTGRAGMIPLGVRNLVNLADQELGENKLHGPIQEGIGRIKNLQTLLLEENDLSGHIPLSFGNLTLLQNFSMSNNRIHGPIPKSHGNLQQLPSLDLSSNLLTEVFPDEIFSLPLLTDFLSLSNNYLSGVLPPQVGKLKNIASLGLSKNNLSGEIPGIIPPLLGNLRGLSRLNLTKNDLSSSTPRELARINGLQQLYLAENNLSGGIQQLFQNLGALIELDLSFNHLDGEVPLNGVFANMTRFSIVGNSGLCGGIPELKLPPCQAENDSGQDENCWPRWLHPRTDEPWHKLSIVRLLTIGVDVADAPDYLHSNSPPLVIQCDLKPRNILLDSDWTAKVANFGLSEIIDPTLLKVQPYDDDDTRLNNALVCLASVARVGILCSKETPSERMNMKYVAAELHSIRDRIKGAAMESSSPQKKMESSQGMPLV
uniref:LRR receptor-like serine/threonine-protein kinase EFR n=2 Tax=Aegilops tauschii TaxID=37682 RepID=M8CB55_AEGTA|nr:receptor kinase-like protein Xa21 [Aegilops tauschii subsp. strangulata]